MNSAYLVAYCNFFIQYFCLQINYHYRLAFENAHMLSDRKCENFLIKVFFCLLALTMFPFGDEFTSIGDKFYVCFIEHWKKIYNHNFITFTIK